MHRNLNIFIQTVVTGLGERAGGRDGGLAGRDNSFLCLHFQFRFYVGRGICIVRVIFFSHLYFLDLLLIYVVGPIIMLLLSNR